MSGTGMTAAIVADLAKYLLLVVSFASMARGLYRIRRGDEGLGIALLGAVGLLGSLGQLFLIISPALDPDPVAEFLGATLPDDPLVGLTLVVVGLAHVAVGLICVGGRRVVRLVTAWHQAPSVNAAVNADMHRLFIRMASERLDDLSGR